MKRKQLVKYRQELKRLIEILRLIFGVSLALSLVLFILSIYLYFEKMLIPAVVTATMAFLVFRLVKTYSIDIARKWMSREAEHEELFNFLDEAMEGKSNKEFFDLLQQALAVVDEK